MYNGTPEQEQWARRDTRRSRFDSLTWLWTITALARVRACRRTRQSVDLNPEVVRASDGSSHITNLQSCASVHVCPVCAPAIRRVRADEIQRATEQHMARGGGLLFLTLTLPHTMGDDLS